MQNRIYAVTSRADGKARLIEATNPAQAMRHVAHDLFDVAPASARTVANLMGQGITLETGKTEE